MQAQPDLTGFLRRHPGLVVLTGAGISAASGIPTYRDHDGQWLASSPIQHAEFLASESHRRRYWVRSAVGWPRIDAAKPNQAHHALVELEALGLLSLVVTQNVDCLHRRAGQGRLIELHGALDRVICIECGATESRRDVQRRLEAGAPWLAGISAGTAPDGDAMVSRVDENRLAPPTCRSCAGILKPDVVFFGGAVAKATVAAVERALDRSPALLVVGSSLMVYSGLRFVRRMAAAGKPVAALNLGNVRGGENLSRHWRLEAGTALQAAVVALGGRHVAGDDPAPFPAD